MEVAVVGLADLQLDVSTLGKRYLSLQSNVAALPRFRAELSNLLRGANIPVTAIEHLLQPVEAATNDPNVGGTTFPYLAQKVVERVQEYLQHQQEP